MPCELPFWDGNFAARTCTVQGMNLRRSSFVVFLAAPTIILTMFVATAGAANRSSYLDITDKNCKRVAAPKEDEQAADFGYLACKGSVGGWKVQVDYDDARESLTLFKGGVEHRLNLWSVETGFSSLGPKLEFRLKGSVPVSAIVRYKVTSPDNVTESRLLVARLGAKPCVVASIPPGPTQSADARGQADNIRPTKPCLAPPE